MALLNNVLTWSHENLKKKIIIFKVIAVCVDPVSKKGPCGDCHKSSEIHLKSIGWKKLVL